ncbi:putative nucleotidyltransferase substrate binding domain-containing protein [Paracoccus sp. (in: a-proteobacteria)]|uniref:[protein-PII] uridylyltransferase family protein n=1 Tax=Paracoccus sp. TaxID=267 RepID=UPI00289A6CA6|nr:putative nucleotidyltransferase substrate binding domain-containing protein [Paracoccus sp. (in: a-proteobacteria)]
MDFAARITRFPLSSDLARGQAALEHFPGLSGPLARLIEGTAGSSPYLAGSITTEAAWLLEALDHGDILARETADFEALGAEALGPALRRAKRRIALWLALADLGGVWALEDITGTLSNFADRATDLALRAHIATEIARKKLPETTADAGGIIVLAMGKMGAGELNYSSDIDLIVLFDETAYAPEDQQEARAALIRATRKAVATLSDITDQGYVFRTDLRLRPDASVTPVCISTAAALRYYEAEGRTWERAAYIKARACAGNIAAGQRFLDEMRPFIWRRHLDFATVQDTQDMRLRIREHKGLQGRMTLPGHDMKLGRGGIREIEFFTQTRQLISGGRDPDLRARGTVEGLTQLAQKGWLGRDEAHELIDLYRSHREVEHRIQMVNDAQTHLLPVTDHGIDGIARMMGASDTAAWSRDLLARLERVETLTSDFFVPVETEARPVLSPEAQAVINGWRSYPALRSQRARQIFQRIEADLLTRMQRAADPSDALARFDAFLAGLPAGVQLFSLFEANRHLIELIVDICGTAPALAGYLARHPDVLDAVLGGSFFSPWPGSASLGQELAGLLDNSRSTGGGDYERGLDDARRWAHEWQFRIGVHHLRALISAEEAATQYADVAEAAISALFPFVGAEFARKHGPPPGRGAVIMGMGSLGAHRLNAASDLDLIVIYDNGDEDSSQGPRPLAARPYYARLTQAMITAISAPTAAGRLFEVDMRLRPSGRQGPLATSIHSFENYQRNEAWTWEHLALTRARVIAGLGADGAALGHQVEALRADILRDCGGKDNVSADLAEMRQRIFSAKGNDSPWQAKIGPGKLQDLELLAQSFALRSASPARGTIAQIRSGQRAGLISAQDGAALASAYRFYWSVRCTSKLLSLSSFDPEALGQGGQEILLRETGCDDLAGLRTRLAETSALTTSIIESTLQAET